MLTIWLKVLFIIKSLGISFDKFIFSGNFASIFFAATRGKFNILFINFELEQFSNF